MNPLAPLIEPLRRMARDAPHSLRVRELPRAATLDSAALLDAVMAQAAGLRRAGVGVGDRVLLSCPNGAAFPVAVLACWEVGACCVLAHADATAADTDRFLRVFSPAVTLARDPGSRGGGALRLRRFAGRPEALHGRTPSEAVVKITSGSTGEPRGVAFTAGQLVAGGRQILQTMGIRPADINIAVVPMAHSYGFDNLILPLALQGSPLAVLTSPFPEHLTQVLQMSETCVFPGVPYLFDLLGRMPSPWRPMGLRLCVSAGALLPAAVERRFEEQCGLPIHTFYGATECGGISFERHPRPGRPPGSVGTPLCGVRVDIVPVDGLDTGMDAGRIVVTSAAAGVAYVPARAGQEGPGAGRFATGDLGRLGVDGRVELVGRLGWIVNVGGRKVNPAEVENALRALPGVRDAVALATTDRRRGEALAACVETEHEMTRERVFEGLENLLPRYKMPRHLVLVEEMPRTRRGKPDMARIRGLLE